MVVPDGGALDGALPVIENPVKPVPCACVPEAGVEPPPPKLNPPVPVVVVAAPKAGAGGLLWGVVLPVAEAAVDGFPNENDGARGAVRWRKGCRGKEGVAYDWWFLRRDQHNDLV